MKVQKTDGCWLWQASTVDGGYGCFRTKDKRLHRAHRFSFELCCGPIPAGADVLHKCDNPACVRPDHLFLGDDAENSADKVAKGRQYRGDSHHQAKLSSADIPLILADQRPQARIAADYGVNPSTISDVKRRKTWKVAACL